MAGIGHNGAPAVVAGTFSDLKTVKSRGVVQLVIEVPIERGAEVVEAFGFPQPGAEIPVAVARLVAPPDTGSSNGRTADFDSANAGSTPAPVTTSSPADKRKWSELPLSQRAALLCSDALFRQFAQVEDTPDAAAAWLRHHCGVKSRADLNTDHEAAERFDRLSRDFIRWKNEPAAPLY